MRGWHHYHFCPSRRVLQSETALFEAFPGLELEMQEIRFLPQESKSLTGEDLVSFKKLLDILNDSDDVQEIYHNIALPG